MSQLVGGTLRLFSADLDTPGSFDAAFVRSLNSGHCAPSVSPRGMQAEVDAVIHTAAVVDMTSNDDQTGR